MKRKREKGLVFLILAAILFVPVLSYAGAHSSQTLAAAGLDVTWLPEHIMAGYSGFGDNGLCDVIDGRTGRHGFINTAGKLVIPAKFDNVEPFSDGIATVKVSHDVYEYIDTKGNPLFGKTYLYCNSFQNGYASYQNPDDPDEWGFMDQTGKTIFTMKCKWLDSLSDGMISYEDQNGNWGFVDEKGNVVIPAQYQKVYDVPYFSEGLAAVKKDGKCGYIDPKGNTVIGFQYSVANPFSDGVAVVSMDESGCGLIDKNQNIIIPMQYLSISNSSEGMVGVTADGKDARTAFFTSSGKQITGFDYWLDSQYSSFHDGIAVVQSDENGGAAHGGINRYGQTVIPFHLFNDIKDFHEGLSVGTTYETDNGSVGSCIVKRPASADVDTGAPTFIQVNLNGKPLFLNANPIMEKDRVLVPVRGVFEGMSGDVSWDDASKTVTVKKGEDETLVLKVGSTDAYVNGKRVQLDVPPEIRNNNTLVPLRFISENLGMKVSWDGKKEIVSINSGAAAK